MTEKNQAARDLTFSRCVLGNFARVTYSRISSGKSQKRLISFETDRGVIKLVKLGLALVATS